MNKAFAFLAVLLTAAACGAVPAQDSLTFNPDSYTTGSLTLPTGKKVAYKAYEKLYFVANVEDSTYQYMNVYVPEGASQKTPILLRTYVGGYMASEAAEPQAGDASGRALAVPRADGGELLILDDSVHALTAERSHAISFTES